MTKKYLNLKLEGVIEQHGLIKDFKNNNYNNFDCNFYDCDSCVNFDGTHLCDNPSVVNRFVEYQKWRVSDADIPLEDFVESLMPFDSKKDVFYML